MPFTSGSVYPKPVGQQYPNQRQAPRSGAKRNRHKRYRKAEPQTKYQAFYESSGSVADDRSIGIDPGHAWIGSSNNTRVGKVWRTPSENLLIDGWLQLNLDNENPNQGSSQQQGSSVETHRPLCLPNPSPHWHYGIKKYVDFASHPVSNILSTAFQEMRRPVIQNQHHHWLLVLYRPNWAILIV